MRRLPTIARKRDGGPAVWLLCKVCASLPTKLLKSLHRLVETDARRVQVDAGRSGVRADQHRGPGVCPGRSAACADPVRHVGPADSRRRERRYCPGARGGHGCELINERRQGPTTRLTLTQIVYTSCKVLLEATWLSAQAVITFRGDTYRIMSLRHASRRERRLYGEAFNE